jgi:acetyl-CoA carboxylase carboxyl transferase subunit alpha
MTSKHLLEMRVVDDVIEEPLGGAHRDHHQMAARMKMYLLKCLRELVGTPVDQLLEKRYEKFRQMGAYLENVETAEAAEAAIGELAGGDAPAHA